MPQSNKNSPPNVCVKENGGNEQTTHPPDSSAIRILQSTCRKSDIEIGVPNPPTLVPESGWKQSQNQLNSVPRIGSADLDPLGSSQGGGMLMDPCHLRDLQSFAEVGQTHEIPPSARYDPIHPPHVGPIAGRGKGNPPDPRSPRQPNPGNPDKDHFPPPGNDNRKNFSKYRNIFDDS